MRTIHAAVARQKGGPLEFEDLQLNSPGPHEVIVRIVAVGMCHTDIVILNQLIPVPLPWVLGHEGAGIVEEVGTQVRHVVPGDPVVLSFGSCGHCHACDDDHSAYCENFMALNLSGARADGSSAFNDTDVKGAFFYQSSFATYALAHVRNVVKVRADAPLKLLGPLGCGIQTGAGSVLKVLKPPAGQGFVVFGAGAVGLSGLMAAKILGAHPIVAVDRVESRLELAKTLGATHVINASAEDVAQRLAELGGMAAALETTGVPEVALIAIQSVRALGVCGLVGACPPGQTIPVDFSIFGSGQIVRYIIEGDSQPQVFIPQLIDYFMSGRFPFDKLVKFYQFEEINQAIADSHSGVTVKPILLFAE